MQQQMAQNQFNQMQQNQAGPPQQFFNQQGMAQHNQQGMPHLNRFERNMNRQQPNYPPPYPQQRMRGPQMVGNFQQQAGVGGVGFDQQQQQYAMQQGMKTNNMQGGVLSAQLQNQNVMGPPTPTMSMQQQMMQSVRSPPPNRSPQSNPSPRAQPSASPRAQPSPHHLPSHSPSPQIIGNPGNDMHNHMHQHQSPISGVSVDSMGNVGGNMNVPGNMGGVGVDNIPLTAQDQLTKFVEQL